MKTNDWNVHTSGSSELPIAEETKNYLQDNLQDIAVKNNQIILKCSNINEIPESLTVIPGYNNIIDDKIIFDFWNKEVENKDTIAILNKVKEILKTDKNVTEHPQEYYNELMTAILTVGIVYSSFVEMLFANAFLTDIKNKKFWRYNQLDPIKIKLGDKSISKYISSLLGLLYQPNKKSIENIEDTFKEISFDKEKHTIYEKIWLGEL